MLGLGIYAAFLYAAILVFNVTLTLPGFAGLVLTLGVAADANVVIFERIKEEARAGRSVRAAIQTGYTKGFATIVDANVVTAITALVLFAVATSSVRGFALMLLIGTAISMLTAVLATRAFLSLLAGSKLLDNPRVIGTSGGGIRPWLKIDFISRRRLWFGDLGRRDRRLDPRARRPRPQPRHRLQGRHPDRASRRPPRPRSRTVREQAARGRPGERRHPGPRRRRRTATTRASRSAPRRSRRDEAAQLQADLKKSVKADAFGVKNVSSSFGRQIAKSAILAIIVSLLLIVGYISIRFQWQFAVPAIVALIHDILITVGIYALLGREVTTATVAAVLTVLGYSIYDTIIIFDRIRENIPLMKRGSFRQITNVSLWETIPRSLATTFITLLPIVVAARLRRRHAQRLRLRAADRHRLGRVLVDLRRGPAARLDQGARARVRAPQARGARATSSRSAARSSSAATDARRRGRRAARARARAGRAGADARAGELVEPRAPSRPPLEPPARPRPLAQPLAARRSTAYTAVMDGNGTSESAPRSRARFEQLLLAGLGWLSLTAEAADDIADDLARRVGIERDAMRDAVRDAVASWRAEAERLGSMPVRRLRQGPRRLGLVRREEADDLALRVAQLEHRVRLLETPAGVASLALAAPPQCDDGDARSPSGGSAGCPRSGASRRATASAT